LFLQCLGIYSNKIITKRRKKEIFLNVDIVTKIRDNFFWRVLKFLQRKHVLPPPFVLSNQFIVYDSEDKAEALPTFSLSLLANFTSPFSTVVNDYVAQLDVGTIH